MRFCAGLLDDLPSDRCVAIGDGSIVVVRFGQEVVALRNRCLHKGSSLDGGRVVAGMLRCPQHFWTYRLPSGTNTGGHGTLTSYDVEVTAEGEVWVEAPEPEPAKGMRELLLAHAREWDRDR